MFRYRVLSMVIAAGLLFSQSVPAARAATVCNSAQFVSDLTIPDGSAVAPGSTLIKKWRLQNNGTCTWTTSYKLLWAGGDQLNAPASTRIPVSVLPGQLLDLSVNLIAPSTIGHYRALFKLSNSAGTQFGIGASSSDAFWVDINVVDTSAVIYDFVANAPYAQWKSGAGALPFPGASGDFRGYSSQVNTPHLEDDSFDTAAGLLTVPQNKFNGYIQATYPEFQIQSGDKLQTLVNCEFGSTGCYVTFRIDYLLPNNVQKTLWTFRESYDRRFYRANLDLSALNGQKVRFVFMLLASGSASADRAIWGSPRIVRTGTFEPPSFPATLTPLPPMTPTATPLAPPPPTLPVTGCDRATFITDITVPDGTVFAPGATFTKTWRLKNSGTCIWTPSYKLIYYSGAQMGAPTTVNFPWGVTPNQSVDLSVNMVAPIEEPGPYRGYWILANANGQFFGIGPDASRPIWVDINVAGEPTFEGGYNFSLNACSAQWRTGSGPLLCPGTEGDSKGFIMPLQSTQLEDGTMGPAPSLSMAPENKYNGYIQGVFPAFTVQPRDHFVTGTGCEFGYSCYVTFRLDYMTANGGVFNFWSWREQKDNKNNRADIDLSPLAGRSVRFILTILATGPATNDRVRWIGPAIVRVEGGTPPTLTPSPTFTPTSTPTSTPIVAPGTVIPAPLITRLFMIDSSYGWAIGRDYVLKTADGGATWYDFSMPGVSSVMNAFFQNANKGWVMASLQDDPNKALLFRTTNGGSTWTVYNNIPFNDGYIQFLDDANGFVLAGQGIGMQKHPVMLYQTSNGGATWTLKFAHDPNLPENGLPVSGHKDGMVFRNTSRGWIGGDIPISGSVYLYRTDNGGVTWAQQRMAIPAGYENAFVGTTAPIFFGPNDGILPVWMGAAIGQRDLFLYITHDGGTTWSRSPAFAQHSFNAGIASIRDAFSWDAAGFFNVTNNSGASWRQVTSNVNFGERFRDMDFVSATTGWVLDADENGDTALYRTNDGGATWTVLFNNMAAPTLSDLTIVQTNIELQNSSCLMEGDIMGTRVWIRNNGQAAAGSFVLRVNNIDQTVNGLGVGETIDLFFPTTLNPVTVIVDATGLIPESDENNNTRSEMVAVPTAPLPCVAPATFAQSVVDTLNAKNFDALPALMDESFLFAYWQSQGNAYPSDQAIELLRTGLTVTLIPNANKDLVTLLGIPDPYSVMGLDASISHALYVSGWGSDNRAEAILYMKRRANGSLYWYGSLIAPTGFASPATLTGPYTVVKVALNDVLNIRSGAGVSYSIIGSFLPDAISVMRTGPTISANNAMWVEVQNPNGGTGWVNSYYLADYVTRDAFCDDGRIITMIEQLEGSMTQQNGDGDMFATLVGPKHGVAINFWRDVPPVEYTSVTARNIFSDPTVYNWGSAPGSGDPDGTSGTFAQIVQPDLVDVFNSNYELGCDIPTAYVEGVTSIPWPYTNIHYYSILKPPTELVFDWKVWLIGFVYVDGVPYLYNTVHYVWDP